MSRQEQWMHNQESVLQEQDQPEDILKSLFTDYPELAEKKISYTLATRLHQILELKKQELPEKEIAGQLGIKETTLATHMRTLKKLTQVQKKPKK